MAWAWDRCHGRATPYDLKMFARGAALGLLLCGIAFVIMLTTDGATTTSAGKLARLGSMAPVLAAIGCGMAHLQAGLRGELLALEAVGVSRQRALAGALAALVLIGLIGAATLASPASDLTALFPTIDAVPWVPEGQGSWRSPSAGVVAHPGSPPFSFVEPVGAPALPAPSRLAVAIAVAATTLTLGGWMARGMSVRSRMLTATAAVALTLVAFHFIAVGRWNAWSLLAGPALLLGHTALHVLMADATRSGRTAGRAE